MKPVRFGIVSTAKIARDWVIPAIKMVPEAEVVAISSRDPGQARKFADAFGIKASYGSLEAMLANDTVEAVYIPTPNNCHVEEAIAAARAGKHVLCEKPLALNADEAARLQAVQAETGVHMTEAFMVRYHPRWIAARDIVRSGRLGKITQIHATYSVMNDNPDDIRFKLELGGGALGDVGVYPVTAARFLFECEPFAVTARAQMDRPGGVDIAIAGMLEFPENKTLLFSGALRQAWAHWIMVTGTEGWMEIPVAVWPSAAAETLIRIRGTADLDDRNVEEIRIPPANQYEHEISTFSKVVRGVIAQPWPISNAVSGMRILDAIRASCLRGERVIFEC